VSGLPVCSGDEAIRAFERSGWQVDRQKGSHVTLKKAGSKVVLTDPKHRELAPGLLRRLIRDAGLSPAEFSKNL